MKNQLSTMLCDFDYKGHGVRVVVEYGEPWFVLKDVCAVLGISNYRNVAARLLDVEKVVRTMDTRGGPQQMVLVRESGLYKAAFQSRKPEAQAFTDWVASEVLPSIRKTGHYGEAPVPIVPSVITADFLQATADQMRSLETTVQKQTALIKAKDAQIADMQPKADYYDMVLQSVDPMPINQIAKDYGTTAIAMNRKLNELGVQYKQGDVWLLYKKYAGKGYTRSETIAIVHSNGNPGTKLHTKWTQKGRLFLYDLLKQHGIVPTVEQTGIQEYVPQQ